MQVGYFILTLRLKERAYTTESALFRHSQCILLRSSWSIFQYHSQAPTFDKFCEWASPFLLYIFPSYPSLLVFGTVCRSMSRPRHHCLSSAAVWRHISLGAAFLDCPRVIVTVVPEKWRCHYGHINRSCISYYYSFPPSCSSSFPFLYLFTHLPRPR